MRYTNKELFNSHCSNVPMAPGVYFVKAPKDLKLKSVKQPFHLN